MTLTAFALPGTRSAGGPDPAPDYNNAVAALKALNAMQNALNTGNGGGAADPTGANDSTAAISAALSTGTGLCILSPGTYLLNGSSGLSAAIAGGKVQGMGYGLTTLQVGSSFTASAAVSAAADSVEICDLAIVGANAGNSRLGGSQAWNGVELSPGFQHCRVRNVWTQFVNGWSVESIGGSSRANLDLIVDGLVSRNCAGAIHDKGVTGSSFEGEHFFSNIQVQQCGTASGASANLDCVRLEDIHDVQVNAINTGLANGSGSSVNVVGACTACYFTNNDLGGGTPTVVIQTGSNGSPTDIRFVGGTIQESTANGNLAVSGASGGLLFDGIYFHAASGDGCTLTNTGSASNITGCRWNTNNQAAGTAYDINLTSCTAKWNVTGGTFGTTVGASSGQVTAPVHDPNGVAYFTGTMFVGTSTTTGNFGAVNYEACIVITTVVSSVPVSGQYLTAPSSYAPGTQTLLTSTAQTFAAVSSANVNTGSFTAPASGSVVVEASFIAQSSSSSDAIAFGLCAHGTTTPMVAFAAEWKPATTTPGPAAVKFYVTGLTPGTAYNFDLMFCVQSGGTVTVFAFGQTSTGPTLSSGGVGSAVVMTVQAV